MTLLDFQQINYCDSPVHRTLGSLDSPVLRTPGSLDSLVNRTPGIHFRMLLTQPRSWKNQNGPRKSLMGPGGAVWVKKTDYKKSRETVPLIFDKINKNMIRHVLFRWWVWTSMETGCTLRLLTLKPKVSRLWWIIGFGANLENSFFPPNFYWS